MEESQLQAMVDQNQPGSRAFLFADQELRRRQYDRDQREQRIWIKRTFWATVVLSALAIGATFAVSVL